VRGNPPYVNSCFPEFAVGLHVVRTVVGADVLCAALEHAAKAAISAMNATLGNSRIERCKLQGTRLDSNARERNAFANLWRE
jgi:hypothetical protein